VQRKQLVVATVDIRAAGRFADVGVGFECRDGSFGVAGRHGALVVADDVGLAETRPKLRVKDRR
jgi:hypothetical protein